MMNDDPNQRLTDAIKDDWFKGMELDRREIIYIH
jgi:hypothetical protein